MRGEGRQLRQFGFPEGIYVLDIIFAEFVLVSVDFDVDVEFSHRITQVLLLRKAVYK